MQVRDLIKELERFDPHDTVRFDIAPYRCPECGEKSYAAHSAGEIGRVDRVQGDVVIAS